MELGKKIKAYRNYMGLSQEELAAKAGMNEKYYGKVERGESCPTIEKIESICNALNIEIVELFLYEISMHDGTFMLNQKATKIIIEALKEGIDIHFNRDNLIDKCEKSIWYNGYIGSICFDEFEMKLYAVGNIKGQLYINFVNVLDLNGDDVSLDLKRYVLDDCQLMDLIEYMPFDEQVLEDKRGDALFVQESNWIAANLVNNQTGEMVHDDIIFDTDNIFAAFADRKALMDYIFG